MKITRRGIIIGAQVGGFLGLLLAAFVFFLGPVYLFHAHGHCIKAAGSTLQSYAAGHFGKFPHHTNGFGDAIVLLLKETESEQCPWLFTAPGDDGHLFAECLKTGAHMPEEQCTRAYVQGLCQTNDPDIALLFDRYATRGGDHWRRPWGPWLREVSVLGGGMRVIREDHWPEFRDRQIKLLLAAGLRRTEAEKLYAPMK
jgi:hypothetical protein